MNETTTFLGTTGTTNTYSGNLYATPLSGGSGTTIYTDNTILSTGVTLSQAITNSNNMSKQVKVAVFTVERNKDNKVTSSKLYGEFWVEVKNGASLELSVAKELSKDFDPSTTVIKEITSFTF
jgi:hypothetical protein